MLYFSSKWDTLELDGLKGGLQIVSQGRKNAPIILVYAFSDAKQCWEYEIFQCPKITLSDLCEDSRILRARSNQRVIELVNADSDAGSADVISDLANGAQAASPVSRILFKGSMSRGMEEARLQRFLQETTREVLNEQVFHAKA